MTDVSVNAEPPSDNSTSVITMDGRYYRNYSACTITHSSAILQKTRSQWTLYGMMLESKWLICRTYKKVCVKNGDCYWMFFMVFITRGLRITFILIIVYNIYCRQNKLMNTGPRPIIKIRHTSWKNYVIHWMQFIHVIV